MRLQDAAIPAYHDPRLVVLSILISILAAYAARNLIERLRDAIGRAWIIWLVCGAIVDGIGIWSMHYTAMLGFHLPVAILYDWPTVLVSLLIGILGSAAMLFVVGRGEVGWPRKFIASLFLGVVGISGLHYTAMAAMRLQGMDHYSLPLVFLSITMAVVFSFISLWLLFGFKDRTRAQVWRKHVSTISRGAANPVMHYIAMAAVVFTYSTQTPDLSHAVRISSVGIAAISIVPIMVLVVSLLTTLVDRLQNQRAHLDELFEQAPQAVVLMSIDNRIVRVNREFTRLFGYTSQESIGRYLNELIVPDEFQDEYQRYADLAARGQRVERDGVRRRKNGSYINVSIILVPISVPGGRVERYAIFRDITERQRAESERDKLFNAVRSSNEQLQVLSRRLVEVQEEERKRLAREIHDDISQSLTALMMQLGSARNLLPKTARAARSILEQTEALTQSTLERTRLMIAGLRPSILDELGLGPALHRLADELHESTGALVTLKTNGLPKRLPSQIEIALFRIAQEALANIRKHAQASEVTVELTNGDGHIILLVQDNGVGIENQEAGSSQSANVVLAAGWKIPAGHFGLIGIQERVKSLGGNFQLTSAPNQGTTIRVELPL